MRSKYTMLILVYFILFSLTACENEKKTINSEVLIQSTFSELSNTISTVNESKFPNLWIKKGKMPVKLVTNRAAVINDKIYVLGFMDKFSDYNELYEYDPNSDKWTKKSPSIAGKGAIHSGGSLAVLNGKLYVFGGGIIKSAENFEKVYNVQEYDPISDKWSFKGELPDRNYAFGAATVNNKIYIIGGELSVVNVYDPIANEWVSKSKTPAYFQDSGITALNGKIYVISGAGTSSVCKYDPQSDEWCFESSIITQRIHLCPVAIDNKIYAINGITMQDMANCSIVEVFDTDKDEWTVSEMSPVSTYNSALAVIGDKVYLIGGRTGIDSNEPIFDVYEYNPALDKKPENNG